VNAMPDSVTTQHHGFRSPFRGPNITTGTVNTTVDAIAVKLQILCRMPSIRMQSSAAARTSTGLSIHALRDRLNSVKFIPPKSFFLRFADDMKGKWTFDELRLDMSEMKCDTVRVSASGTSAEVEDKWGNIVQLDSLSFRYLVDPNYAAEIDKSIRNLHMKPEEAKPAAKRSMDSRDPRWHKIGDEDDL
jgi:hypothetical protein